MSELDVQNIAKTLQADIPGNGIAVLRGASFHVQAGTCMGLKGATGAGKSTLLRIIAGLERPDAGEVRIDRFLVASATTFIPAGKRRLGFVFQNMGLWPHLSVAEHLDYVLSASPFRADEREARKEELLEQFHLADLADRRPHQLSGGEQHLLAIARSLSGDIRLLLMDEPFEGLDGQLKDMVLAAIRNVLQQRKLTTVLVSHDERELKELCSGIIHLREGHVIEAADKATG